jgi:hypothetical protein
MGFIDNLRKYDRLWIGISLGLLLPLALYPLIRPLDPENFAFISVDYHKAMLKLLPMLLSRCVFPNALLFFLLIWIRFDKTARGVLYSTVGLTAILILIQIIY